MVSRSKRSIGPPAAAWLAALALAALLAGCGQAKPHYAAEYVFEQDPGYPSCHCASLIELANGDLLCAWYGGSGEGQPDVEVRYSRRAAGASSWTPPTTLVDQPGRPEGNPVLWQDPTGKVWCFYCTQTGQGWRTSQLKRVTSTDDGATWSLPVNMVNQIGYLVRCPLVVAGNGNWVLPAYDERDWTGVMFISADQGATWKMSGRISTGGGYKASTIQPSLIKRSDGSLRALCRMSPAPTKIYESVSTDHGWHWSPPKPTELPNPNASVAQCRLANGHVVLIFNNSATERTPLTAALSEDEGATWPVMRNLETGEAKFSYPWVMQGSDGLIHVVYTYKRTQIKHVVFDEAWLSAAGG